MYDYQKESLIIEYLAPAKVELAKSCFLYYALFETLSLGMKMFVCSNNGKSSKEKNRQNRFIYYLC